MYRAEAPAIDNAFRIEIDHDLCIGSGTCVSSSPEVFRLDENGQAVVHDNARGSRELLIEAVANCPSEAIALHLVDDPMPA